MLHYYFLDIARFPPVTAESLQRLPYMKKKIMLKELDATLVMKAANDGLDRAIKNWAKIEHLMRRPLIKEQFITHKSNPPQPSVIRSSIPGHPFIEEENPEVDEFIALAVDMRKSSARLRSKELFPTIESGIQRVYYETSTLLPALAQTALLNNGHVTEYLGDGLLILFKVDAGKLDFSISDAYTAAHNCVHDTRIIVNNLLQERLLLPNLDLGAGLSISQALITFVGIPNNMQPKAIGQCVWEASKLSYGINTVNISRTLRDLWPPSQSASLRFRKIPETTKHPVDGFCVFPTEITNC